MDSLTQIVLGAACGEAVLGKKIGNKALLFGAIGGTIPDLDVFIGSILYGNKIQAMTFHRGFMHSILFSIIGAFIIGWLAYKLYDQGKRLETTNLRDWQRLFFWSLFTHPILDCFTPYGTQLFYPISNYRVAFNNIAVADPFYTVPFLFCLIVMMFFKRNAVKRKIWLKAGIGISSIYLLFTLGNKLYIDNIFEKSLGDDAIKYSRFRTQPTLFNSILWYGVVETDSAFYMGFYSHFDSTNRIKNWQSVLKNDPLGVSKDKDLSTLAWFSDNYYVIRKSRQDSIFKYSDLRYPLLDPNNSESSLFTFKIFKNDNRWDMTNSGPDFNQNTSPANFFQPIIERIKGI